MRTHIITEAIRVILILLFCYTAASKWLAYDDFLYQLRQSPSIHSGYGLLSFFLPGTEFLISGLLLFSHTVKTGFALSAILLTLFTGYIAMMLLFAPHVPCSCGGFISSLSWQQHIILNSTLAFLAIVAYRWQEKKQKSSRPDGVQKSLLQ